MRQLESAKYSKTWQLTRGKRRIVQNSLAMELSFASHRLENRSVAKHGLRVGCWCWKCQPCPFSDISCSPVWWQPNGSMLLVLEGWGGSLKLYRSKFCTMTFIGNCLVSFWSVSGGRALSWYSFPKGQAVPDWRELAGSSHHHVPGRNCFCHTQLSSPGLQSVETCRVRLDSCWRV